MSCEPLVDERVVGRQQVHDARVVAQHAPEQKLRFFAEALPQVAVELAARGAQRVELPQPKPLRGEVRDERVGFRVREHAPHLPLEDRRLRELAGRRSREQRLVGDAAPEEEREA